MDARADFDALFSCYHAPLYRYLVALLGEPARAQALAEDAFVAAYRARHRTPEHLLPLLLYREATARALTALRQRPSRPILPLPGRAGRRALCPPSSHPVREAGETLCAALAGLTPRQQACLLLRVRASLSIAEIAYVLDMSPSDIAGTLSSLKEQLRCV